MNRVFVLGNATIDVVLNAARLPGPGETCLAEGMVRCAGGKGLNQALAAANAGANCVFAAPIGSDSEAAYLRETVAGFHTISARWIAMPHPTDHSSIWVAGSGENMILSSAHCARALTSSQARTALADLAQGDTLLVQGNLTAESTREVLGLARARGAITLLNTAPIAWDMRACLALCDVVLANAVECALLVGSADASALRAAGAGTAIVTLGAKGATVAGAGGLEQVSAPPVAAIDTAGAGDVFAGVVAALLCEGRDIRFAAQAAVHAASLSVTRRGTTASFPTCDEMAAILANLDAT
ncbi:MAG: ribokinase [Telmatospirillum sp.]|nr:ribokinase [Telmatospirillum sp.]